MQLVVGPHKIAVPVLQGSLLQSIYLSGLVEPLSMCSGMGSCGRCRVRFLSESAHVPPALPEDIRILGQERTAQGWRLSCKHKAISGAVIELPPQVKLLQPAEASPMQQNTATGITLAVDFGSTSLHFSAVGANGHSETGKTTAGNADNAQTGHSHTSIPQAMSKARNAKANNAHASAARVWVNPQMGAGADIISRIAFSLQEGGQEKLTALSQAALRRMVAQAQTEAGQPVREICLTANPAMCMLLLGKSAVGLAAAPYRLDYAGGQYETLPGLPPVWLAPLIAPFVGGDLSAGYASLACKTGNNAEFPFVLADMGTNGEFILALSPHKALAASLPLGPALEGIGMSCGAEARPGVITSFQLSPAGLEPQIMPGGNSTETPSGISATGYISLIAQLLKLKIIGANGLFSQDASAAVLPLARRLAANLCKRHGQTAWSLGQNQPLCLTASDVEEMLKIKAAFSLALKLLLRESGLCFTDLKALYLAGALGEHANTEDLQALGFIPAGSGNKIQSIGNSSLAGAELLAARPELRQNVTEWAKKVQVVDIVSQNDFQRLYTEEMQFGG